MVLLFCPKSYEQQRDSKLKTGKTRKLVKTEPKQALSQNFLVEKKDCNAHLKAVALSFKLEHSINQIYQIRKRLDIYMAVPMLEETAQVSF